MMISAKLTNITAKPQSVAYWVKDAGDAGKRLATIKLAPEGSQAFEVEDAEALDDIRRRVGGRMSLEAVVD